MTPAEMPEDGPRYYGYAGTGRPFDEVIPQTIQCAAYCWTAKDCPDCGLEMPPTGRSVPDEMVGGVCGCEPPKVFPINPRHLWHEHDDARWYSDPEGWKAHVANCDGGCSL